MCEHTDLVQHGSSLSAQTVSDKKSQSRDGERGIQCSRGFGEEAVSASVRDLKYTAIPEVTGILWFRRSSGSTGRPMDSEEYTPLWIPTGRPLNLNEPALGIPQAAYCSQKEPECTERGIYFGQHSGVRLKIIFLLREIHIIRVR
jgi:hypothetical protein